MMVELLLQKPDWRIRFKKSILMCLALVSMGLITQVHAQVTPTEIAGAPTDMDCAPDAGESFNFSEETSNGYVGTGAITNGLNSIEMEFEYEGPDTDVVSGSKLVMGAQNGGTDIVTLSFSSSLTNPVITIGGSGNENIINNSTTRTEIFFTDCDGNALDIAILSTTGSGLEIGSVDHSVQPPSGTNNPGSGGNIQILGDHDCIVVTATHVAGTGKFAGVDTWGLDVATCIKEIPEPECATCLEDNNYSYLSLSGYDDNTFTGDVNLDGTLFGSFTVLDGDEGQPNELDQRIDVAGSTFGAFDTDGGTFLMQIDLCEPISVEQIDIMFLESMSETWVGTDLSGGDVYGIASPGGIALTRCDGSANMVATGNMVTNTSGNSRNQSSARFNVDGGLTTSTLTFRYSNPTGGPTFDYAAFRIGTCVPDAEDVVPACPLTRMTITEDAAAIADGTEPSSSTTYVKDANGVYFAASLDCGEVYAASEAGTALAPASVSPCAEVIDEMDCLECTPVPTCIPCAGNETYEYINLANYNATTREGDIFLDGVLIGTSKVIENTLAISEDLSGTRFGAFASGSAQTEVLIMELDFCEPLAIQQIDILGLEDQSQVWVGTTLSGSDVTGGTIDDCGMNTDSGMLIDGTSNTVINQANNCRNQGDGNYQFSVASVSTLYFKYENKAGSCNYDKTTYRIGVCTTPAPLATPECSLELYSVVTKDLDNPVDLYKDAKGLWFPASVCATAKNPVEVQSLKISPCMTPVSKSICENCFIPPVIGDVTCTNNLNVPGEETDAIITKPFYISATGLKNMKATDNNEVDFGLNVYLYPEGEDASNYDYPPSQGQYISIAEAVALGTQPTVPVLLGTMDLVMPNCTEANLEVTLPADFPQGTYAKVVLLDQWPEGEDPADQPSVVIPETNVIPTMGQWALFILAMLMSSLAMIAMRQKKNHEVKELA